MTPHLVEITVLVERKWFNVYVFKVANNISFMFFNNTKQSTNTPCFTNLQFFLYR